MIHSKVTLWKLLAIPVLVLGMAFVFVGHVQAQDIVPADPAAPATDELLPAADTPVATETAPDIVPLVEGTPEAAPTDTVPVVPVIDIPPVVDVPPMEETTEVPPVVEQPADPVIDILIVDETPPTENVPVDGDPYYDYLGIRHYFFTGSCAGAVVIPNICTLSATPISAAITSATSLVTSGSVTIYVEGSHTYAENVSISGPTKIAALVGMGVWTPINTYPVINGTVTLSGFTTAFTLSGFTINAVTGSAALTLNNNTGAITITDVTATDTNGGANGINVTNQTGALTLKRVHADGSSNGGLAVTTSSASLNVSSSSFDDNGNDGIYVNFTGSITMNGVSASGNTYTGAYLNTNKPIIISNANFAWNSLGSGLIVPATNIGTITLNTVYADHNNQYGIFIYNKGNVTLSNVRATYTTNYSGIYIETCNWSGGPLCPLSGSVSITNAVVDHNHGDNLYVAANGAITLNTVSASYAGGSSYGGYLENVHSSSVAAVTINNGTFSNNPYVGLYIYTKGNVSLNHIIASSNSGFGSSSIGMHVNATSGIGTVTLLATLGANEFNENSGTGVSIASKGSISLTNIEAGHNGSGSSDNGIYLDNSTGTGGVTINTAVIDNNQGINLYIATHGNTSLADVNEDWSGQSGIASNGAYITNEGATGNPTVSILRSSFTSNNSDGLNVRSKGTITLNSVRSSNNNIGSGGMGARLNATFGTGGVAIIKPSGVNLSFLTLNTFYNNTGNGLDIQANGTISIAGIDVYNSGGDGVVANNSGGTGDVILTDVTSRNNSGQGVRVHSQGAITYNKGLVYENPVGYGIELDNYSYGTTIKAVTLSNISTHDNADDQLWILTRGAVTIKTIEAYRDSGIGYQGIHIQVNGTGAVTIGVLLSTDTNHIYGNPDSGLWIQTLGAISLTNINSHNNGNYGAYLNNPTGTGAVTITNSHFNTNLNYGLYVITQGAITLKGGSANNITTTGGALLDNHTASGSPAVSVSTFEFNNNYGTGLEVRSKGAISLYNAYAQNNNAVSGSYGAYLDNFYSTVASAVTISGVLGTAPNVFTNNDNDNLYILSNGAVTLSVLNASGSHYGYGANIDNSGGSGAVSITSGNFDSNPIQTGLNPAGLLINSNGAVALTSVSAYGNGDTTHYFFGAYITTTKAVTIKTSTFTNNRNTGLVVRAGGNISLTNVTADSNGIDALHPGDGAYLDNTSSPTASVTVTNNPLLYYRFYSNTLKGLVIYSNGKVTLTGIQASWNDAEGVLVDNYNGGTGVGDVVMTNIHADYNGIDGLDVTSNGAISLTLADIYYSGYGTGSGMGANLDNHNASLSKAVTVTKSSFEALYGTGLYILAHGSVTLNGITASINNYSPGNYGVYIDASYGGSTATVTVLNTLGANKFEQNSVDGLYIYSGLGAVTLNGVYAANNWSNGVHIQNAGTVTVSNSTFYNNSLKGLWVEGSGNIVLNTVTSTDNSQEGALLDNHTGAATVTVSVSKSTFSLYNNYGLTIVSRNTVTLNGVYAEDNYSHGVNIDNSTYGTGGVTILSTLGANSFNRNSANGLWIQTNGAVAFSKVTANQNYGAGAYINTGSTVTITTGNFNANYYEGLKIISNGLVTLTGVNANMNGSSPNRNGIDINSSGHDVTITNGVVIGNGKSGIYAVILSGQKLILTNVLCAGNDTSGGAAPDVYTDGALIWI